MLNLTKTILRNINANQTNPFYSYHIMYVKPGISATQKSIFMNDEWGTYFTTTTTTAAGHQCFIRVKKLVSYE